LRAGIVFEVAKADVELERNSSAAPSFNPAIGGCFPARIQEPHRLHVPPEVPQAALLTLDSLMCQLLQRLRLVLMSSPLVHQALARVPP
jgi:hypothetical protein